MVGRWPLESDHVVGHMVSGGRQSKSKNPDGAKVNSWHSGLNSFS